MEFEVMKTEIHIMPESKTDFYILGRLVGKLSPKHENYLQSEHIFDRVIFDLDKFILYAIYH